MSKALTVHNAEIKTAAVEIRTLTISGKQVTLAVFRQLREEPLIAEDGTLNGVPWGIVNYHPDKCANDGEHIHVVWQLGVDLMRCRVNAPKLAGLRSRRAAAFLQVAIAEGLNDYTARRSTMNEWGVVVDEGRQYSKFVEGRKDEISFRIRGMSFIAEVDNEFFRSFRREIRADLSGRAAEIASVHGSASALADRLPVGAYKDTWKALNDLPQLFIAV